MATSKSFLEFVTEQLSDAGEVTTRPMMGEYLVYFRGKLIGDICDDGAKTPMILVDDLDDRAFLQALLEAMYDELPAPKPKKPKTKA